MTHPPPPPYYGAATAPWPPPAPPQPVRRSAAPILLAALLVGFIAFAGFGTAGFLISRATASDTGPASCGSVQCIPTLSVDALIAALQERGFACPSQSFDPTTEWTCELRFGPGGYRASITSRDGLIQAFTVGAQHHPDLPASESAISFLSWFAVLPFGLDPEAEAAATQWLTENASARNDSTAEIRGYHYELTASGGGLELYMFGSYA